MSRAEAERRSIKPLVKILSWATCGVEPSLMGLGPIPAVKMALKKQNGKLKMLIYLKLMKHLQPKVLQ